MLGYASFALMELQRIAGAEREDCSASLYRAHSA